MDDVSLMKDSDYQELLRKAKAGLLELLELDAGWELEEGKTLEEGIIHCQKIRKYDRKIFRLQGIIDMAPRDLWLDMVNTFNESPKWNKTLLESRTLQVIDEKTEIVYTVSDGSGPVDERDFVNIRQSLQVEREKYLTYSIGCTHRDMPKQKKYKRGYNGPGGWAFEAVPNEPNKCKFTWIVNTDLKGFVPGPVKNAAMSGVLSRYFRSLVRHYKN